MQRSRLQNRYHNARSSIMQTCISLVSFTEEGFRHLKETAKRARAFRESAKRKNINIRETYWTLGQYDIVHLFEAPDHEAAASRGLCPRFDGQLSNGHASCFQRDGHVQDIGKRL